MKVGITPRLTRDSKTNELRFSLDTRWIYLLRESSLFPVVVPFQENPEKYLEEMDLQGMIFSGGGDLSCVSNLEIEILRDNFERGILSYCYRRQMPILGVCRGMQFLAVENGASIKKIDGHVSTSHRVKDVQGFFSSESFVVNSFHNYTVSLPAGFIPLAVDDFQELEAMQDAAGKIFGVMWHPERNPTIAKQDRVLLNKVFGGTL